MITVTAIAHLLGAVRAAGDNEVKRLAAIADLDRDLGELQSQDQEQRRSHANHWTQ